MDQANSTLTRTLLKRRRQSSKGSFMGFHRPSLPVNSIQILKSPKSPLLPGFCMSLAISCTNIQPKVKSASGLKLNCLNSRRSQKKFTQGKDVQTTEEGASGGKILSPTLSPRLLDSSHKQSTRRVKKILTLRPQKKKFFDSSVIPNNCSGLELDQMGKYFKTPNKPL